jgi:hypothetical protein
MPRPARSRDYVARRRGADDERELELLQEFTRCGSVAALAGVIAARLPRTSRPEDLIAEAGLAAQRPDR